MAGVERVRIDSAGFVGVGVTPLFTLHVASTLSNFITFERSSAAIASFQNSWNPDTTDGNGVRYNFSSNTTGAGATVNKGFSSILSTFLIHDDATLTSNLAFQVRTNGAGLATSLTIAGADVTLATAVRLAMASGANQRAGNLTLIGGTLTVANTSVTANTIVLLTRKTAGGTIGTSISYTVIAATSFTVTSDSALDTSTFSYLLVEVP